MFKVKQWVIEVTNDASIREIASRIGASHTNTGRRIRDNDPLVVIDIAKAYGANPIALLVEIGHLRQGDIEEYVTDVMLEKVSELRLAEEIVIRLRRAQKQGQQSDLATVTEIPARNVGITEYRVADSSPDEQEGAPDDYDA